MWRIFPTLVVLLLAVPAFAADRGAPNILKLSGTSEKFMSTLHYDKDFIHFARNDDGTYDAAIIFDIRAVETTEGPEANERIKMMQLPPGRWRVWMGNLTDRRQRVNMPEGEVIKLTTLDPEAEPTKYYVHFRALKLKPGSTERINFPCRYDTDPGQPAVTPTNHTGYWWAWVGGDQSAARLNVIGIKDNGIRFEVSPDGASIIPKGLDLTNVIP